LFFIGFKLLKEEEEVLEGATGSGGLLEAISTIVVADVVMSVDNILGVAAAAHGDIGLLIFGLLLSMIIMLVGGNLIASMIDRFWWLVYLGSAVIVWTGAEMLVADPAIAHLMGEGEHHLAARIFGVICTIVVLSAAHYYHRHRPRRRRLREQVSS
ncbi:MAG: TerC family protein, partial [Chloroflexota bacterium]